MSAKTSASLSIEPSEPRLAKRTWVRTAGRWLTYAALLGLVLIAYRVWPRPPLHQGLSFSNVVLSRKGELLRLSLAADDRYRLWLPLAQISPQLIEATLLKEDRWFYYHPGVNPYRLVLAAVSSYSGGRMQGASTVSMQLARMRYRLYTRSAWGKLQQIGYALLLEAGYSKDKLLEAYLNLAPYGGNIEGVGAASLIYFAKPAAALSLPEALTLAVLPQRPAHRGPKSTYSSVQLSPELLAARTELGALWQLAHGPFDRGLFQAPLMIQARAKVRAPHLARLAIARNPATLALTPITTELDLALQEILERQIRRYLSAAQRLGVRNAAAILVDTRDMGVKALVGSADFENAAILGQVDGTQAQRSPGSTLKPFIYALAIDQGVLHPKTLLADVPSTFGNFSPENFDGRFRGPLTAADALVRSRNVPAVRLAEKLRAPGLYGVLQKAQVRNLAPLMHYGLSLSLGGGEVSPAELAALYAMLARDGRWRPLRYELAMPASVGVPIISPEAAFITREMLYGNPRPKAAKRAQNYPVAWKTGTSWGFRDAWSAGIVGQYVLVVWLGNFDGRSNPALIGGTAAAPLFFAITDDLQAGKHLRPRDQAVELQDLNIREVEICAASGELPNVHCPVLGKTWFIPGVSSIRVSSVHRRVYFQSDKPVCIDPGTLANAQVRATLDTRVAEFWPSEIAASFAAAGLRLKTAPACSAVTEQPPQITAPISDVSFRLTQAELQSPSLSFVASAGAGVSRLFWFADGNYIGQNKPGEALRFTPGAARTFNVEVIDDLGGRAKRKVPVYLR